MTVYRHLQLMKYKYKDLGERKKYRNNGTKHANEERRFSERKLVVLHHISHTILYDHIKKKKKKKEKKRKKRLSPSVIRNLEKVHRGISFHLCLVGRPHFSKIVPFN